MTESRLASFDKSSCGIISSTSKMEMAAYSIPQTPENEQYIETLSSLLTEPTIVIYNSFKDEKEAKPNVLMFFNIRKVNGRRVASLVDAKQGNEADKLWDIITGKATK